MRPARKGLSETMVVGGKSKEKRELKFFLSKGGREGHLALSYEEEEGRKKR